MDARVSTGLIDQGVIARNNAAREADLAAEYEALYPGDDPRVQEPCVKIDIPLAALERIRTNVNQRAEEIEVTEVA